MQTKHPALTALIARLQKDLPKKSFQFVDNWDDPFAIGVAKVGNPRQIVYVSCLADEPDSYYYDCEKPGETAAKDDITTAKGESSASYEDVVAAIKKHFLPPVA